MGERCEDRIPEGCFPQVVGRPMDPADLAHIRAGGVESLCRFFLDGGLNEQSRYKLLRGFFPMSFREFKALERRVAGRAEPGAAAADGRDPGSS